MRRLLASWFVIGAICFATWTANTAITFAADDGDTATLQADNALQLALRKKAAKAVGALLDQQFSWTTDAGQTQPSPQFLKDATADTSVCATAYNKCKAHDQPHLATP